MEIKISNLSQTFNYLENLDKNSAKKIVKNLTQELYENVRFYAKPHHITGMLERNIRHKVKDLSGVVWIDDSNMLVDFKGKKINYASFVLFGSRPHLIKPKKKKAIRYINLEHFVFAKTIHHPGYKGDDFMHKALQKTIERMK